MPPVDAVGSPLALRVGVLLPTREAAMTGRYAMRPLLDFARAAEQSGFDSVWAGDSLTARPRFDPFVVLSGVAAVTERVAVGTAALTAALRHPLLGANTVAALDHAAGAGRLRLGLGSGFPLPESQAEFEAVGVPFRGRSARLDETSAVWRTAWRGEGAAFTGRYLSTAGLDRIPPTATPGGPPLWLASGDTPRVLERVAEHYDGWLPFLPDPAAYAAAWSRIEALSAKAGRPADAVTPALYATVSVDPDHDRAEAGLDAYVRGYYGYPLEIMRTIQAYGHGDAEGLARWLGAFVAAGARHLVLRIGDLDPLPQLTLLAEQVLPRLREAAQPGRDPAGTIANRK
jgi:alkanesulfonate monooxygenase SsuD/methylene tetrahydromethanopterin reductase-like flavin-dependent oxidoreductase (luciferase family)